MSTVSVIIPAYNQDQYLGEAVKSVFQGIYQNFELIIVDDGSTDSTQQVAQSFNDPRIKYIYQKNRGLAGARNTGIRNSTGTFIVYLDSDDLFTLNKLLSQVEFLENNAEYGLVAGQNILIGEDGRQLEGIFDTPLPKDGSQLLLGNPITVGSVLLRREWQHKAGFFDEKLRSYEDWDMWLRLAKLGCKMGWVSNPVYLYRFHDAQMTRDVEQMTTATFAVLNKTFEDPNLPQNWKQLRNQAYSQANIRGAAQAYNAKSFDQGKKYLEEAVRLDPNLSSNDYDLLAKQIMGWANFAKTADPLPFLSDVYNNLPKRFEKLRKRRQQDLAEISLQMAFTSFSKGNHKQTQSAIFSALRYQPQKCFNRGIFALFAKSFLNKSQKR